MKKRFVREIFLFALVFFILSIIVISQNEPVNQSNQNSSVNDSFVVNDTADINGTGYQNDTSDVNQTPAEPTPAAPISSKKFQIKKSRVSHKFVLANDTTVNLKETAQAGVKPVLLGDGNGYAAKLNIDFNENMDFSRVTVGINKAEKKSFIHNYKSVYGLVNVTLLIPMVLNSSRVYICPGAFSFSEVNPKCNNKAVLQSGQMASGMWFKTVEIDNESYYEVFNISGTGGAESSNSNLNITDETDDGSTIIYTNDNLKFSANYSDLTTAAPISGGAVFCLVRFNITNVSLEWTDYYNMSYDSASKKYEYIRDFAAANGTFFFNVLCNDSSDSYDVVNASDDFNVTYSHWHIFYGNVSGNLSVATQDGFELFRWTVNNVGNVYSVDSDSSITWNSLWPLGRDTSGGTTSDDYSDVDVNLQLESGNNVSYYWADGADSPHTLMNFSIFSTSLENVSISNSTNNTNFVTGILWDSDDDEQSGGTANEYDKTDKEDVVFAGKISNGAQGKYGTNDYEIMVPENLKDYKAGSSTVDFYIELR